MPLVVVGAAVRLTTSDEAKEIPHALTKPRRETFLGVASLGTFLQARFSDCLTVREYLAEFGGDRRPLLEDWSQIDLGNLIYGRLGQRLYREHRCDAGQQSGLSEAIARSEAHRFLLCRPMFLCGDQNAGAQNEESLSDAALLDKNISGFVSSPLHLGAELNALVLGESCEDGKLIE